MFSVLDELSKEFFVCIRMERAKALPRGRKLFINALTRTAAIKYEPLIVEGFALGWFLVQMEFNSAL